LWFLFRYKHELPKKIEECSYYNRNYSVFAKNGYNWSMQNLDKADLVPCQYYDYSNRGSVVAEVNIYFYLITLIWLFCFILLKLFFEIFQVEFSMW
jgi:hypothetical protein